MVKKTCLFILFIVLIYMNQPLFPHCQVPCGIYDDKARIKMIAEHITTIEKAMKQIAALSKKTPVNYNQIVRWVFNKEKHAEELSQILTYYFMAQRVKPVIQSETMKHKEYQKKLELLHHLMVFAMKAKQSTELSVVEKMRILLKKFERAYF